MAGVNGVWRGLTASGWCEISEGDGVYVVVVSSLSVMRWVPAGTTTLGDGAAGMICSGARGRGGGGALMRAWAILDDVGAYDAATLGDGVGGRAAGLVRREKISLRRLMARNWASPGC